MKIWGITDTGMVRKENQDAYCAQMWSENSGLGVVCDGMGGAKAGNVASTLALDAISDTVKEKMDLLDTWDGMRETLTEAVSRANEAVYTRASGDDECSGMGTTVVAALAYQDHVLVVNIGDSRCYRLTETGIEQVTRDHSLVEDLVARGKITHEEARTHPKKNLITRALGVEREVRSDYYPVNGSAGEYLLLCSDGLSNIVTDQEILFEVIHGGQPEDCCRRLLDIALSRGAPDNVTVVLLQL